jgi:hypothetical protein
MFKKLRLLIPGIHYCVYDEGGGRYLEIWRQWLWFTWGKIKVKTVNRRAVNGV